MTMDDIQEDIDAAAQAHQQELDWQRELTCDPGYFDWLIQLAAEAALRTETNDGDHGER